ncbi:MAG: cyclic nucleotide-binding domain-containing protein [Chloroflexi bacterium]|nr:cyclic nucleotide-binding domain-containing protein [Chloroflexota bacterium]
MTPANSDRIRPLPNSMYVVDTLAGSVLVNCPPEALKYLLAEGLKPPKTLLLPPDMPAGRQLGSMGFVRQGINYASVEFVLYANFFGSGQRTHLITATADQARRLRQILDETINGPEEVAAYGNYGWLQKECDAVGYYPPLKRPPLVNDLAEITSLEADGGDLGEGVSVRLVNDRFVFAENGEDVAILSTAIQGSPAPLVLAPPRPLLRQEITLQFIGGSDGFDPTGITTCFLAYLGSAVQTQATLFDAAAYLRLRLGNLGVSPSQLSEVVLSHLHEDHLAGLPELILMGDHRLRLLTSDIVYRGLLRVLSAMLAVPESEAANLFDYYPLNPGHPLVLDGRRFEAIYAVHSIPTIAVRANALCYSGDMRYDEDWFNELEQQGVLSPERHAELVHFADGAEVLVQDVGGGSIHTTLTPALLKSLTAKGPHLVLAHIAGDKQSLPTTDPALAAKVEFARSGTVTAFGETVSHHALQYAERVETISACPLFSRLSVGQRIILAEQTSLAEWADGQIIMRDGDASDGKTYIIHSGLVEVWVQGKQVRVIGRGNSIGERGALQGDPRSGMLVARGKVQLLSLTGSVFKPIAESLGLVDAFNRADWLWTRPVFSQLPWATLLDLALDFQPRKLQAGDHLFEFGEPGYECYLLVSGAISVLNQQGEQLGEIKMPGEFFGARAALFGQPRNASAQAIQPTEIWALPAPALQRLQMVYPNVLLHLRVLESGRHGQLPSSHAP